jgi:hypothetical protein
MFKSEQETYVGIELEPSIRGEKLDCWRLSGIAHQLACSSEKRERSTHSERILGWEQDTEVIKTAWNTHQYSENSKRGKTLTLVVRLSGPTQCAVPFLHRRWVSRSHR